MSGQLIFNQNIDIIPLQTVTYDLTNFRQRTALQLFLARSTVQYPIVIPANATDLLISITLTIGTSDAITLSDFITCLIWDGIPALENTSGTIQQFTGDKTLIPGVFFTGPLSGATATESFVAGPNAATLAPLLTRIEASTIFATLAGPITQGNRISNPWASGSSTPISVPCALPASFKLYMQATSSADFIASANASLSAVATIYAITQT